MVSSHASCVQLLHWNGFAHLIVNMFHGGTTPWPHTSLFPTNSFNICTISFTIIFYSWKKINKMKPSHTLPFSISSNLTWKGDHIYLKVKTWYEVDICITILGKRWHLLVSPTSLRECCVFYRPRTDFWCCQQKWKMP